MAVAPAGFVAQTEGTVATVAGTAKTFLNVIAAANKAFQVDEVGVAFDGITAAAKPILVELCTSTQATAGTPGSAVTPRPHSPSQIATVTSSAQKNYSAEPTVLVPIREWWVHPQAPLIVQFPLGREFRAINGQALALRVTLTAAETVVNGRAYISFEE